MNRVKEHDVPSFKLSLPRRDAGRAASRRRAWACHSKTSDTSAGDEIQIDAKQGSYDASSTVCEVRRSVLRTVPWASKVQGRDGHVDPIAALTLFVLSTSRYCSPACASGSRGAATSFTTFGWPSYRARGALHYHVLIWLPLGLTLPKSGQAKLAAPWIDANRMGAQRHRLSLQVRLQVRQRWHLPARRKVARKGGHDELASRFDPGSTCPHGSSAWQALRAALCASRLSVWLTGQRGFACRHPGGCPSAAAFRPPGRPLRYDDPLENIAGPYTLLANIRG